MSKSGYGEMLAVLQYMDSKNKKETRWTRRKKEPEIDLVTLLHKKKAEAEILEKFLKDQEKINKKEDAKKGFEALTVFQRTALFTFIGPPLGLFYMVCMIYMFKAATVAVGANIALNAARFG